MQLLLDDLPADLTRCWNADRQAYEVAETENYLIDIVPMLYNHRVVMTSKACLMAYDHGWCYDNLLVALAAVIVWDPATEAEPSSYKKRATPWLRSVHDI